MTGKSLRKAVEKVSGVAQEDDVDKAARQALQSEAVEDRKSARVMRETYATQVFQYLVWYSVFSLLVLVLQGTKFNGFNLDDKVVAILVGSTAVSAIGLVGIVVRGLFK